MSTFKHLSILLFSTLLLNGCNNSSENQGIVSQQQVQMYSTDTTLTGKVSNKEGSVRSGEVKATDNNNNFLASAQVNKNSQYSIIIPAKTELPITLTHTFKNSDEDALVSVVIYSSFKKFDINDLTTVIAKKAKSLGGYTRSNMSIAADSTVGVPDANKTSTGFRGDPTTQYGGWH